MKKVDLCELRASNPDLTRLKKKKKNTNKAPRDENYTDTFEFLQQVLSSFGAEKRAWRPHAAGSCLLIAGIALSDVNEAQD